MKKISVSCRSGMMIRAVMGASPGYPDGITGAGKFPLMFSSDIDEKDTASHETALCQRMP